jgi:hypothetical protein
MRLRCTGISCLNDVGFASWIAERYYFRVPRLENSSPDQVLSMEHIL